MTILAKLELTALAQEIFICCIHNSFTAIACIFKAGNVTFHLASIQSPSKLTADNLASKTITTKTNHREFPHANCRKTADFMETIHHGLTDYAQQSRKIAVDCSLARLQLVPERHCSYALLSFASLA